MFAMKPRADVMFRIVLAASILFSAPLNSFSAQAAAIKATPTATSVDTPVAETPAPISTIQPEATDTVPPVTATAVPDTGTPPGVTGTVVPSATATPPAIDTASPTDTVISQPSLSLSTMPDFIQPNSTITLFWEITGVVPEEHKQLLMQITLSDMISPSGKYDGTYDAASHILTIPVTALTGQVDLITGDKVSDTSLYAALLDGTDLLAESKLPLSTAEKFQLDSQGGTVSALAGKVQVVFSKDVLTETTSIEIGPPSGDAIPAYSLSGQPFEINAKGEQSKVDLHQFKDEIEIDVSYADLNMTPITASLTCA